VASDVSPDGTTVLFHLPRKQSGGVTWDLWTAPLAGGKATLLRRDAGFAAYAPDGSIVFLHHPFQFVSKQIWMMNEDGSNARLLVKGGTFSWPSVSPDGTRVAYGNDGNAEIVDIATHDVTPFDVLGEAPAWDGNNTLIVDDENHSI
jgi:Tol biopolymer transport system component